MNKGSKPVVRAGRRYLAGAVGLCAALALGGCLSVPPAKRAAEREKLREVVQMPWLATPGEAGGATTASSAAFLPEPPRKPVQEAFHPQPPLELIPYWPWRAPVTQAPLPPMTPAIRSALHVLQPSAGERAIVATPQPGVPTSSLLPALPPTPAVVPSLGEVGQLPLSWELLRWKPVKAVRLAGRSAPPPLPASQSFLPPVRPTPEELAATLTPEPGVPPASLLPTSPPTPAPQPRPAGIVDVPKARASSTR